MKSLFFTFLFAFALMLPSASAQSTVDLGTTYYSILDDTGAVQVFTDLASVQGAIIAAVQGGQECSTVSFQPQRFSTLVFNAGVWEVDAVQGTVSCTPELFFPGATGAFYGGGQLPGAMLSAMESVRFEEDNNGSE